MGISLIYETWTFIIVHTLWLRWQPNKHTKRHTFNIRRTTFSQKKVWAITCFHIQNTILCLVLTELICYAFNCREISSRNSEKLCALLAVEIIKRETETNAIIFLASNCLAKWRNLHLRCKHPLLSNIIYYHLTRKLNINSHFTSVGPLQGWKIFVVLSNREICTLLKIQPAVFTVLKSAALCNRNSVHYTMKKNVCFITHWKK